MLFKRALFKTGDPVVLFLTRHKIDPFFKESKFKCRRDEENPDASTRYCYPVFGSELSLETALETIPIAICVGYEIEPSDGSTSLTEIRRSLENVLAPVLKSHQFDLSFARKEFRDENGHLSGAFIAANTAFRKLFEPGVKMKSTTA